MESSGSVPAPAVPPIPSPGTADPLFSAVFGTSMAAVLMTPDSAASSPSAPTSRLLHLSAPVPFAGGLGDPHAQHALVEVGGDAVLVDVARQRDLVVEAADGAFAAAQDADAFLLLALSAQGQPS